MSEQILLALAAVSAVWVVWFTSRVRQLKVIVVIDGDTYETVCSRGRKYRVRLRGCDCPESDQPFGPLATRSVHALIHGKWVTARFHGRDRYRRHLVSITHEGQDLARILLRNGWAFPMPGAFSTDAVQARFHRLGVWQSSFRAKPWEAASRRKGLARWLVRAARRKARTWRRRR